ncbi:MAG: glutamate-5-semialdehyde dehydrogenase [Spirochaetae bacterium HGW-Spirochaetae-1]|nr:MAG: glutamate-5-semialdehyde dehydrogenase [Spirochaetae bacterium HGW-Spirochaetae-1]
MDDRQYIEDLCIKAKKASTFIARRTTSEKNNILLRIASLLREKSDYIIAENEKDINTARAAGLSSAMIDRLVLNRDRIMSMSVSVEEIAALEDPVGRIENMRVRPSGIRVGQMRVPIGVVAVIYESRPNVTTDIAALCIKSGNASILRGGRESIHSNTALYGVVKTALAGFGYPEEIVTLITRTDRELVSLLLKKNDYIDIVIPRGGEGLIRRVTEESTIPVIKHDKGVCHTFIDAGAVEEMANRIAVNAKVQRPGVCNSMETLLIHRDYPRKESLLQSLLDNKVELRGCRRTVALMPASVKPALEDDWAMEYLDLILSVRIVDTMEEAMDHIARYGSGHSESIVTNDYFNAERFLKEVDSSAVFVNASTRFHDGGEFGLGAEVGISTQKLHARGAMGVEGLTTQKYVVYGSGEIR